MFGMVTRQRNQSREGYMVFDALKSRDCRKILELADDYHTANQLSEKSDIPRSTIYRKIDILTESGLLEESIKLRSDGRHTKTYKRKVEHIDIEITGEGINVYIGNSEDKEIVERSS